MTKGPVMSDLTKPRKLAAIKVPREPIGTGLMVVGHAVWVAYLDDGVMPVFVGYPLIGVTEVNRDDQLRIEPAVISAADEQMVSIYDEIAMLGAVLVGVRRMWSEPDYEQRADATARLRDYYRENERQVHVYPANAFRLDRLDAGEANH